MKREEEGTKRGIDVQGTVKSLSLALIVAIAVAILGFFKEDLIVRATSLFKDGDIGGKYIVELQEFKRGTVPPVTIPLEENAELEQFNFRVVAKIFGSRDRSWTASGYYRSPYLSLAYKTGKPGGTGLGTYMLQEVPEGQAFKGYWVGVECKPLSDREGDEQIMMICPCLFYRVDRLDLGKAYAQHVKEPCSEMTRTGLRICPVDPAREPKGE